jgi:hypothetical protein
MATNYVGVFPKNFAANQVCTPVAVAATGDTIDGSDIVNDAVFVVIAAGTPTNVAFVDPGHTPAGTAAGTVTPQTVAANTSRCWGKTQLQGYIDPTTNKVGVTYSSITAITALVVG